jgi:predicted RNase H-like HicB family nuclease
MALHADSKGGLMKQNVVLTQDQSGWIVAECPELPGCISQSKNESEALANIRDAIKLWLWAEEQKPAETLG